MRRLALVLLTALLCAGLVAPAAAPAAKPPRHGHKHKSTKHEHKHKHKKKHTKKHKKKKKKKHEKKPAPATPTARAVPVSFSVVNRNDSAVPCNASGAAATIRGTMFLPAGATPQGVTLYLHGLGFSSTFWDFTAVPGYDYAAQEAKLGHASVVIDRLGYGASTIPNGNDSCVGSQATIAHQVVQALRGGSYSAGRGDATPAFSRVGLAGHSAGGQLAQIEAYSFHDIDALAVVDWADQTYSPAALTGFAVAGAQCLGGGMPARDGAPSGYGVYGSTTSAYDALMFHDTDPAVLAVANATRTKDPCGDLLTILSGVAVDALMVPTIEVPVVYVWGTDDGNYIDGTPWWQLQEALFLSSPKVTDVTLDDTGHAVTLERSAPQTVAAMDRWLGENHL
jgi:pimeloyl-ACP methyl ester carboxylesterase